MAAAASGADILREVDGAPFVHDLALHEEGVFADFLTARDGMLPGDEALLAAQWALVDRSIFEVRGVDRDRLDLYDIGWGESIAVVNSHPGARVGSGSVLIGRPLPVGDTYRSFGGFMVVPRCGGRTAPSSAR